MIVRVKKVIGRKQCIGVIADYLHAQARVEMSNDLDGSLPCGRMVFGLVGYVRKGR
jgi:hypothetical protein